MEYRSFKEDKPSLLGFGCMRFPVIKEGEDSIDWPEAEKLIDYAYSKGVTYYDTAYPYHGGESEKFIGWALNKYPRNSFYLATKMPTFNLQTPQDVERIFAEQLERTNMEYFDYYLIHALSADRFKLVEELGVYDFLQKQKAEGKIRHLGFSFHDTPEVLETICAAHEWDFAQLQINYLDWEVYRSREQYEILCRFGIPCIVMEPVRGGRLADLGHQPNEILKNDRPNSSIASWAMRYAATLDNVFVVLSGMSTMQQTVDNIQSFTPFEPLDAGQQKVLQQALDSYKQNTLVPCTACRYCMPCPAGVDIPGIFALFNNCALQGGMKRFTKEYAQLPPESMGGNCVNCGQCVSACPQNIAVPDLLAKLERGEKP